MSKHKYLKDIGVIPFLDDDSWTKESGCKLSKKQRKRIKKFYKKYGVDERETWEMLYPYCQWVYEHCAAYLELASGIIDLDFHKIEVDGKEYTQREAIEKVMKCFRFVLKNYYEYSYDDWIDRQTKCLEKAKDGSRIFAELIPYMWW